MQPIAAPLLQWFDANKRLLPFRQEPSAYHIWVSEIMLQQTRVAAAIPYYERFIAALPDPAALAACEPDALRKLWQGLGYYNRVNNMQKAARIVCEQYGGDLPADYDALRSLPGIGDYTAGAVASIAFGIPVPAVDGNVLRVFARLYNDDADVMTPATKKAFTVRVLDQMPKATPGPYNEALMELGALVCIPGTPHCEECPLADLCRGYAAGRADQLPVKPAPKAKGKVPVTVALIESEQGLLLQRRPARGLLAGLWQPAAWEKALTRDELTAALAGIGVQAVLDEPLPPAKHVFTHKIWELGGWRGTAPACALPEGYVWAAPEDLAEVYPVPNAFGAYVKARSEGEFLMTMNGQSPQPCGSRPAPYFVERLFSRASPARKPPFTGEVVEQSDDRKGSARLPLCITSRGLCASRHHLPEQSRPLPYKPAVNDIRRGVLPLHARVRLAPVKRQ